MAKVHVFVSTGRFSSFQELRSFVDKTYSADGDSLDSPFIEEVRLTDYEPGCIEAIVRECPQLLEALLAGASYADQWLHLVPKSIESDAALCVYSPNQVGDPNNSSIKYIGAFEYKE